MTNSLHDKSLAHHNSTSHLQLNQSQSTTPTTINDSSTSDLNKSSSNHFDRDREQIPLNSPHHQTAAYYGARDSAAFDHHQNLHRPAPQSTSPPNHTLHTPNYHHTSPAPLSTSMKSSVMHQTAPPSSMQAYPAPASIGFSSVPDTQHSTSSSFAPQSAPQHSHLPNAISLHQPVQHPPPQQHHSQQHHSQPLRSEMQQKMAPPQHQAMRRYQPQPRSNQQLGMAKPQDQVQGSQVTLLPQMNKVPQQNVHMIPQQGQHVQHRYQQVGPQAHMPQNRGPKGEVLSSVPLPLHPDPIQPFQPAQDGTEGDRGFNFGRQGFFDELSHEENPNTVGLPPPHAPVDTEQGNTIGGVDSLTGHLGMNAVPNISSLALPGISGGQNAMHGMAGFGAPASLGNAAIVGGASEIAEAIVGDRSKGVGVQRRMRSLPRSRNQHMTESQRKQRHNEHTRASRSRIDKGLERLKNTIKKVRPHQKVTKKADVLQEAVKLLKEGFRLPPTESDEEREDQPPPHESSLSV